VQIITMPVHQHADLWFPGLTKPPVFAFTARVGILHAQSRGWVKLRSADPRDLPRIRFNMFQEQADMDAMIDAVKLSRTIFSQPSMRDLVAEELLPGQYLHSDAELAQAIRAQAEHRHHAVGTCRMGDGSARRGRRQAARPRHRQSARGRCLGHAGGSIGQHQCADDDDRRESGRYDPGARAGGGGGLGAGPQSVRPGRS
jgi:hypothetical protein